MPGNVIEQKMWNDIDAAGGVERIIQRIADGETMGKIAESFGVSRTFMSWKVNGLPGVKEQIAQARRSRAEKLAEETLTLADNVGTSNPVEIKKVAEQIRVRQWLAGVDDPDRFGPKQQQVNITVGGLHLDALRKVQAELAAPAAEDKIIEGEAKDVTPQ